MAQKTAVERTTAAQLPSSLLTSILQHLPWQHRLNARLVCSGWAAAAAAATEEICTNSLPAAKIPSLQLWLQKHGGHLKHVHLRAPTGKCSQLLLPCAALTSLSSLQVHNVTLQLPAAEAAASAAWSGGSSGSKVHLPQLQHLAFTVDMPAVAAFAEVTSLTSLELHQARSQSPAGTINAPQQLSTALSTLLQHQPKLARLVLTSMQPGVQWSRVLQGLAHRTCVLQPLRELRWNAGTAPQVADAIAHAPGTLTRLDVRALCDGAHSCLPASLSHLRELQHLWVDGAQFHPSALASLPSLQHLDLVCCRLLPETGAGTAAAAFVAALGCMTGLQHLQAEFVGGSLGLASLPPRAFSALTASSQLRHLELVADAEPVLPMGAVRHIFPRGRQLPQLTHLSLFPGVDETPGVHYMAAAELPLVVAACPALQHLQVVGMLPGDTRPLLQLPACCTSLFLSGDAFNDAAAAVIGQMTQLRRLMWGYAPSFTDAGLEQLTALTRLTSLHVMDCPGLSQAAVRAAWVDLRRPAARVPDDHWVLERHKQNGEFELRSGDEAWWLESRDMPVQLGRVLDASPLCAPTRLKQAREEVQQLQQRNSELQRRVVELEQGAAEL